MTIDGAVIQVVPRTTNISNLVVRRKIHLSRANGQVEFRALTDCVHASSVNMFKNKIDKYLVKAGYT